MIQSIQGRFIYIFMLKRRDNFPRTESISQKKLYFNYFIQPRVIIQELVKTFFDFYIYDIRNYKFCHKHTFQVIFIWLFDFVMQNNDFLYLCLLPVIHSIFKSGVYVWNYPSVLQKHEILIYFCLDSLTIEHSSYIISWYFGNDFAYYIRYLLGICMQHLIYF